MAEQRVCYRLRCTLYGHSLDVRAVQASIHPNGGILTGSRDKTTRIWNPIESSNGFVESMCFSGPSNFVSSICCLPSDDKNPFGLIAVGSNDSNIYVYSIDSPKPLYLLKGHGDTVCALNAGKFGTLLSGSWDKTVKVWLGQKIMMTLSGHQASVWAVQIIPEHGYILTGSADRSIKMWKAGRCEHTFNGHTDCVRGLVVLNSEEFLSCANDTSIRRWSVLSHQCLQVYLGHTSFIYSIAVIPNTGGLQFVTSGEDHSVRVWNVSSQSGEEVVQTIKLPAQTIWTTACLQNGDIVCGSSDGAIRVFTTDPTLTASIEEQKLLEEEVSKTSITAQEVGSLKESDLSPKGALLQPGKRDGHTIMVRDGSVITAHQWSASENRWMKVGDVVGSESANPSGKSTFEGKEYDYVFTVDIEEGKPPLSLPYNISQDPWAAAQTFIAKNNLSPMFLEQVANFIIDNTKGVTLSQGSSVISDPFTGGNRYIPGSGNNAESTPSSDPFTGAGRYVPKHNNEQPNASRTSGDPFTGNSSYVSQSQPKVNKYFPQDAYVKFEVANTSAIVTKLKEFNSKVEENLRLSDSQISKLQEALDQQRQLTDEELNGLEKTLRWPDDIVFPSLDILRLVVRNKAMVNNFCRSNKGEEIMQVLLSFLGRSTVVANHMLTLRTLSNFFFVNVSEEPIFSMRNDLIGAIVQACSGVKMTKHLQIALTTVLVNFSILFSRKGDIEAKSQLMSAIVTLIDGISDAEAGFRLLVCLGTLIHNDPTAIDTAKSFDILLLVKRFREIIDPIKVAECAGYLVQVLS